MEPDGHIYITGQIGNSYDDKGAITSVGVELINVVESVQALGSVENIYVHINSPGGFVEVGNSIADFLSSLKQNVFTIAEEMCASIATKIHLCVPLENRSIQANCKYIIHNPFVQNVSGDADQLADVASSIKNIEVELESMYAKQTGLSKEALSGLMKIETGLTPEQCVKFGFASNIVNKETAPVALIYNEKENEMKKPLLTRALAAIGQMIVPTNPIFKAAIDAEANAGRSAVALVLETDNGTIETPFSDLMVGDPVMIDGEPAPDGTYVSTTGGIMIVGEETEGGEGTQIVITGGVIESITPAEVPVEDSVESLKAQLLAEQGKTASLTAENTTLKAEAVESEKNAQAVVVALEAKAKLGSAYVPPAQNNFRQTPKPTPAPTKSLKEKMEARKQELKKD